MKLPQKIGENASCTLKKEEKKMESGCKNHQGGGSNRYQYKKRQ